LALRVGVEPFAAEPDAAAAVAAGYLEATFDVGAAQGAGAAAQVCGRFAAAEPLIDDANVVTVRGRRHGCSPPFRRARSADMSGH